MANRTIYVSRLNSNSNKIKLRDSEGHNPGDDDLTTFVDTGDTVTWKLDTNSGLSEISKVEKKSDTHQLLTGKPQGNNGIWTGTVVSSSPGIGKKEKYKIYYKIAGDDKKRHDDPILQMNN